MTLADRLADRLIAHPRNPLCLPEAPEPAPGSAHQRLEGAVRDEGVLLHGSNARDIRRFEPREQTTARDRVVRAVFATADPIWAMFFAVTRVIGRWNMCLRPEETGFGQSRYFFAVRADPESVWTAGAVYLLPRESFEQSDIPAEWISTAPVEPLEVVPVGRDDFPLAHRVFRFDHPESDWVRLGRLIRAGLVRNGQ